MRRQPIGPFDSEDRGERASHRAEPASSTASEDFVHPGAPARCHLTIEYCMFDCRPCRKATWDGEAGSSCAVPIQAKVPARTTSRRQRRSRLMPAASVRKCCSAARRGSCVPPRGPQLGAWHPLLLPTDQLYFVAVPGDPSYLANVPCKTVSDVERDVVVEQVAKLRLSSYCQVSPTKVARAMQGAALPYSRSVNLRGKKCAKDPSY